MADHAAQASACTIRLTSDLIDMEAAPYTGARTPVDGVPETEAWSYLARGFDSLIDFFPSEEHADFTDARVAKMSYEADTAEPVGDGSTVAFHEWMHQVVFAVPNPSQGWPRWDVHGLDAHPEYAMNADAYFAAMLQGRVLEEGHARGILPSDWLTWGTWLTPGPARIAQSAQVLPPVVEPSKPPSATPTRNLPIIARWRFARDASTLHVRMFCPRTVRRCLATLRWGWRRRAPQGMALPRLDFERRTWRAGDTATAALRLPARAVRTRLGGVFARLTVQGRFQDGATGRGTLRRWLPLRSTR